MKFMRKLIPYIFLIIGLIIFFYPLFLNPDNMPGSFGDARFINYVLEHGYLWVVQSGVHTSFWDMPIFYPYKNTLAFSDMLIGGMIIYIPVRFVTECFEKLYPAQTALQIWFMISCILNYSSFYLLMRKVFKFERLCSSVAAFLFAFGLPRHVQIGHLQLSQQYFTIFSILAFVKAFSCKSEFKKHFLLVMAVIMFVLQVYTSFYFGWYMIFGVVVFTPVCFLFKNTREKLLDFIKTYWREILIYGFAACLLLIPLLLHYSAVNGKFSWQTGWMWMPESFLCSESLIDELFFHCRVFNPEIITGIGLLTTVFVFAGIFKSVYRKQIILFILIVILFFTNFFYMNLDFNYFLYKYFPGASAIRAAGRAIFLLLPFFCCGIAIFMRSLKSPFILVLCVLAFIAEQLPFHNGYDWTKSEHAARLASYNFPSECKVIYYDIFLKQRDTYLIDIMWKASEEGIYTANGYSGFIPVYIKGTVPSNCIFQK